ncbi:MAG: sacsin N-terminal ATP-binding-like domain-containing protein [Chloroflexota bacterium]
MLVPPPYFDAVRRRAREDWDALEARPDLAGPWWQLFRQVQSPRHVLSELLQNADDAGATWARAGLVDGALLFEHDGEDFDENAFQSLCRFGFSNKRRLHTIGFRGVGFKSTFSLGPRVDVYAPTLAVAFHQRRFTEPEWVGDARAEAPRHTTIRVSIDHADKLRQMEGELARWAETPVPLLFFRSVQRLELQGEIIAKAPPKCGPVPGSYWVDLHGRETDRVLHVVSEEEEFPADAMEEVRRERGEADFELPPCRVELVLGIDGDQRLYAVLPTDVEIDVPFSVNAPFVQDPAREGIRAPSTSPTNTWLLRRAGELAASAMLGWLGDTDRALEERAAAYALAPAPASQAGWDNGQQATRLIAEAFGERANQAPCLLTQEGNLAAAGSCRALPAELHDVWDAPTLRGLFGGDKAHLLAGEVGGAARDALRKWQWIDVATPAQVAERLTQPTGWAAYSVKPVPRPASDEQILVLWDFLQSRVGPQHGTVYYSVKRWIVVPTRHRPELKPPADILVVGGKEPALSDDEWEFLTGQVAVADPLWLRRIAEAPADEQGKTRLVRAREPARRLGLEQRVGVQQVVDKAATEAFDASRLASLGAAAVRLAQIAAKVAAQVRPSFRYLCQDGKWRPASDGLVTGNDASVEELFPKSWLAARTVSDAYTAGLSPDELLGWRRWASTTARSGLHDFPVPDTTEDWVYSRAQLEKLCAQRGGYAPSSYYYKSHSNYTFTDHDYDDALWAHWRRLAGQDADLWVRLARALMRGWSDNVWGPRATASAVERWGDKRRSLDHGVLVARWVHRLQDLECLPDTRGSRHGPAELLRSTPDTAPLIDVEPFLAAELDRPEHTKLLDLLGVRSQPANADKLVARIRGLSHAVELPDRLLAELANLYRALDRVSVRLPAEEIAALARTFREERLIRTEDSQWQPSGGVYQDNSDDLPDTSVVLASSRDLVLWDRLSVQKRPSLESAIEWLRGLPVGRVVQDAARRRIRDLLRRAPARVWAECRAWLDLSDRWTAADRLVWRARTQAVGDALFSQLRQTTADLSMVEAADTLECFAHLSSIEQALEWRVAEVERATEDGRPSWLHALGLGLSRVTAVRGRSRDAEAGEAALVDDREVGSQLASTRWTPVDRLLVAPHINGEQVGAAREQRVSWQGDQIYVQGASASYHQPLVVEVSRPFRHIALRDAVAACVDREPSWIRAYLAEQFDLLEEADRPGPDDGADKVNTPDRSPRDEGDAPEDRRDEPGETPDDEQETENREETDQPTPTENGSSPREPSPRAPRQPSLQQRFRAWMIRSGYAWDEANDTLVDLTSGAYWRWVADLRIWTRYDGSGEELEHIWVAQGTLEAGIEVPAHVWRYFEGKPDAAYLGLEEQGRFFRLRWRDILRELAEDKIESFAMAYVIKRRPMGEAF